MAKDDEGVAHPDEAYVLTILVNQDLEITAEEAVLATFRLLDRMESEARNSLDEGQDVGIARVPRRTFETLVTQALMDTDWVAVLPDDDEVEPLLAIIGPSTGRGEALQDALDEAEIVTTPTRSAAEIAPTTPVYGAALDVIKKRIRLETVRGYDAALDDVNDKGELVDAAIYYASDVEAPKAPSWWPWGVPAPRRQDRRDCLVTAAALIIAEIERLDRADLAKLGSTP